MTNPEEITIERNPALRRFYFVVGWIALGLGILGVLLPLLPTTPFVLLAAACFARSSQRFYDWLLGNRHFGHYIRDWRAGKGIPRKAKLIAIAMLALTLGPSTFFLVPIVWVQGLLAAIGLGVSIYIWRLPTSVE